MFFMFFSVFCSSWVVRFLFFVCFFDFLFQGSLHSGRSEVTRVTVGRDTDQSFRVCKVDLSTLKVARNCN